MGVSATNLMTSCLTGFSLATCSTHGGSALPDVHLLINGDIWTP